MAGNRKTQIKDLTQEEKGKKAQVSFWKMQIDNSIDNNKDWLKESKDNYKIYYNTDINSEGRYGYYGGYNKGYSHSYNLFYSNVETKRPLLYSKLPTLDIRRRYRDKDRNSKIASEMLERTCNYFLDNYEYDIHFKKIVLDKIVSGRGIARLIFEPGIVRTGEMIIDEETGKEVAEELQDINLKKIRIEFVPYDRILMETAKKWEDVTWIAFKHQLSKSEIEGIVGKKEADNLNYPDSVLTGIDFEQTKRIDAQTKSLKVLDDRITVWEIWDKIQKEIILFAPTSDKGILKRHKDNYNLENFFPIPRPLGLLSNNISIIPIPEFRQYKIQYLELQKIEDRIRNLTLQAKAGGVYLDILGNEEVANLLNNEDGVYSPIKGGATNNINDLIFTKDPTPIVNSTAILLNQKAQIINDIREITGLSDIVRGVTKASETATAQKIKGDFAISRMQLEQQEIEFYVRDTLKLMTELIAENYTIEELAQISGLNVINIDEVIQGVSQQVEQQVAQLEAQANEQVDGLVAKGATPEQVQQMFAQVDQQSQQLLQQATQQAMKEVDVQLKTTFSATNVETQQINAMIKNDKFRSFNIDIETESTIKIDNDIEKAQRVELLNTLTGALNALVPMQQAGILTDDAIKELIGFVIRPFKVGRNLEESLVEKQDTSARDQQQAQLQQAEMQMRMEKEIQLPHRKLDIEQQKVDDNRTVEQAKIESNEIKVEIESDTDLEVAEINAESRIIAKELGSTKKIEADNE